MTRGSIKIMLYTQVSIYTSAVVEGCIAVSTLYPKCLSFNYLTHTRRYSLLVNNLAGKFNSLTYKFHYNNQLKNCDKLKCILEKN